MVIKLATLFDYLSQFQIDLSRTKKHKICCPFVKYSVMKNFQTYIDFVLNLFSMVTETVNMSLLSDIVMNNLFIVFCRILAVCHQLKRKTKVRRMMMMITCQLKSLFLKTGISLKNQIMI